MAEPTFLTKPDVADLFKISIGAINYLVRTQQIPYHRLGNLKLVRFEKTELFRWFEKRENIERRYKPRKTQAVMNEKNLSSG